MGNQLETTTSSGGQLRPPVPISLDLNRALLACRNGLQREESGRMLIHPDCLPEEALREQLRARVKHLGLALDRRDRDPAEGGKSVIRAVVARMFDALTPTAKASDEAAMAKIGNYRSVLAELPLFAVVEACGRFARGLVAGHNPAFPPTAAEIHAEARKIADPWSAERASILQVLTAKALPPPPSARDREKTLARIAEWERESAARREEIDREKDRQSGGTDRFAAWRKARPPVGFEAEPDLAPRIDEPGPE